MDDRANQSSMPQESEAEGIASEEAFGALAAEDPDKAGLATPPERQFLGDVGRTRLFVTTGGGRPFDLNVDAFTLSEGPKAEFTGSLSSLARMVFSPVWDNFEGSFRSYQGDRPLVPEAPAFIPIQIPERPLTLIVATPWSLVAQAANLGGVERATRAILAQAERRSLGRIAIPLLGAKGGGLPPVEVVRRILAAAQSTLRTTRNVRELTIVAQEQEAYDEALVLFNRIPQRFANDLPGGEDLLDISSEIQALTDILLLKTLQPPLAVGILGGWGTGKSFAMDLMRRHIQRIRGLADSGKGWDGAATGAYVGHIYPITFDAWTYAKSNLWASLMQTIFLELSRQVHLEKRIRGRLKPDSPTDLEARLWLALQDWNDRDRNALFDQDDLVDHLEALTKAKDQLDSDAGKALWEAVAELRKEQQTVLVEKEKAAATVATEIEDKKAELAKQVDQELKAKRYEIAWKNASTALRELVLKVVQDTPGGSSAIQDSRAVKEFINLVGSDVKSVPMGFTNLWHAVRRNPVVTIGTLITAASVAGLAYWLGNHQKELASILTWGGSILTVLAGLARTASLWRAQVANAWKGLETDVRAAESQVEHEREALFQKKLQDPILSAKEEERRRLDSEIQRLKQQIGFTADYVSVADLVQARLQKAEYEGELGLLHRVQRDLDELSQALCLPEHHALHSKLREQFPRGPARIVLFIDDLDRCPPDRVVEVLEAVQLLVKTPLFVVVLAMDVRYITRALEKVYKEILLRGGNPNGLDYIEKIIQLPYSVRPIDGSQVERFLRGQMDVQTEESAPGSIVITPIAEQPAVSGTQGSTAAGDGDPIEPEVVTFSTAELGWVQACCEKLPLSPRAVKRVVNALKLLKIVWFRPNRHQRPDIHVQQAFVALLSLSAAYPNGMRVLFADLSGTVRNAAFNVELRPICETAGGKLKDCCSPEEAEGIVKNLDLIPDAACIGSDLWATLELIRSLSFVAEIGYDPADRSGSPRTTAPPAPPPPAAPARA